MLRSAPGSAACIPAARLGSDRLLSLIRLARFQVVQPSAYDGRFLRVFPLDNIALLSSDSRAASFRRISPGMNTIVQSLPSQAAGSAAVESAFSSGTRAALYLRRRKSNWFFHLRTRLRYPLNA